jgi:hypothetical protein
MKVRMFSALALIVCACLLSAPAFATTASGTVTVTATIAASVSMTFNTDASGIALGGSGTSAATMAFGNVQEYGGTVPANVTKTVNGVTSWTLSTPFDVTVSVANQTSTNYTLTAQLAAADAQNTWAIGAIPVVSTAAATLTATGAYNTAVPYTLNLTIPDTGTTLAVSKVINFVATAN